MSGISLKELGKVYGSTPAVEQVTLDIGAGELVVFVGPSGCGKTTTLRMLAGFVEPSSGSIVIDRRDVTRLPPRLRNIGMVFQDYALFPSMTVRENIAFGLEERGTAKAATAGRVAEMLALIRMDEMADRLPRELSGGQQQRVALARALAYHPSVLLMDEPLGALDQKLREEMQRELVTIQKRLGITTIFVTHDQQEAMAIADRIVVMRAGRIEQVGTADELYGSPASLFTATFIGRSNQLRGRVCELAGGRLRIALEGEPAILARAGAGAVSVGDPVTCVIRPEHLRILADGGRWENSLPVTVERASRLGSFADVLVRTGSGVQLVVQIPSAEVAGIPIGEGARVAFAADEVVAFPGSGG